MQKITIHICTDVIDVPGSVPTPDPLSTAFLWELNLSRYTAPLPGFPLLPPPTSQFFLVDFLPVH